MEVLVLDGRKYTKVSKAAKDLGYTSDYVGQLCRSGKVSAHLIGRSWYVDQEELSTHRTDKKRASRVKAREQVKRTIKEHRVKSSASRKGYTDIAISYENDDRDLLPETRKITVASEEVKQPKQKRTKKPKKDIQKNIIENEGKKILMHGSVSVVDVTYGVPDPHTTVLTPTIISSEEAEKNVEAEVKKKSSKKPNKEEIVKVAVTKEVIDDENTTEKKDFLEKLEDADAIPLGNDTNIPGEESIADQEINVVAHDEEVKSSIVPYIVIVVLTIIVVIFSLTLTLDLVYTANSPVPVSESIKAMIEETIELISSKL